MSMEQKGALFVISGPSGVGKGTIIQGAMQKLAERTDIKVSLAVSVTTRAPRLGEIDGVHYHFISREKFFELLEQGELLEYTKYAGNYYGTPAKEIVERTREGTFVLLDIETAGAMEVKKNWPDAVLCFILPPSMEELERRLRARGTETEESIARRLEIAENERAKANLYDYQILNDTLLEAVDRLVDVLLSWKNKKGAK
ncbi:MAG TPA: guanylate kinase [Clostridiales bacterium]|nr:guanylate kinase [Clostridiales bacterium]